MFDVTPSQDALSNSKDALCALQAFVGEHRDALLNAGLLLGAGPGLRLARTAIKGLQGSRPPTRRAMRDLERLLRLLRLENAHTEDTIEAECFAMLDPTDPCVKELCLLADQLSEFLSSYRDARKPYSEIGRRAAA
jgi:hypothetical protein